MSEIRLYNSSLTVTQLSTGNITIIDATVDDLMDFNLMDSEELPSPSLIHLVREIADRRGLTWKHDPVYWSPRVRALGGSVFISNLWQEVV